MPFVTSGLNPVLGGRMNPSVFDLSAAVGKSEPVEPFDVSGLVT